MIIQWLGQSCFKIQTKGNQGETIIVADPFVDQPGLKMPRFQADIVTMSCDNDLHNNADAIRGEPYVIVHPGEYETRDVFIYGVPALAEKAKAKITLFKIFSEDISVAHLSDLSSTLNDEQIDHLGNVDVLLLPVGGDLDIKKANEVTAQIDPRIVIPMNCKVDGQKSDLKSVDDFVKNCGLKSEKLDKLKIAKKDLMTEDTRVIVLTI